jgi:hypothetical protein
MGGETEILEAVSPAAAVLASVSPERNALLLFNGKSAHGSNSYSTSVVPLTPRYLLVFFSNLHLQTVGRDVMRDAPKILLRGDVYFDAPEHYPRPEEPRLVAQVVSRFYEANK